MAGLAVALVAVLVALAFVALVAVDPEAPLAVELPDPVEAVGLVPVAEVIPEVDGVM